VLQCGMMILAKNMLSGKSRIVTAALLSALLISSLAATLFFQNGAESATAEKEPVTEANPKIEENSNASFSGQIPEERTGYHDNPTSVSQLEAKVESSEGIEPETELPNDTKADVNSSQPEAENASPDFFMEHFDGTTVDSEKWVVQENTNMSGYPAYGGSVSIAGSQIFLSSSKSRDATGALTLGSGFPCVTSAANPFPTSGDFSIEFKLTYTCISDWGNGFWISKGPFIVSSTPGSSTVIFQLWADNDGYDVVSIKARLFGEVVYFKEISGWEPSAPPLTFTLEYCEGVYTLFVMGGDGFGEVYVTSSVSSLMRPDTVGFGHPPAYYIPFSPGHVSSVIGGWGSFAIDYIRVRQLAEAEEENQISVSGSSSFFVESNSTLSSLSFDLASGAASFTVSGPSGTGGYVQFLISKTLLKSVAELKVYLDGRQIDFAAELNGAFHELYFEYSHSTHVVYLSMPGSPSCFSFWILVLPLAGAFLVAVLLYRKRAG
jgi:hypothetical protein